MNLKIMFLILLFFAGILGCAQKQEAKFAEEVSFKVKVTDSNAQTLLEQELKTVRGKSAFEALLENKVPADFDNTAYGPFIKGLYGIAPANGEYIAIYADGNYAQAGIAQIYPQNGMILEFRLEKIDPSKFG